MNNHRITGAGLAFKPAPIAANTVEPTWQAELALPAPDQLQFVEIAAEQWLGLGGVWERRLQEATQHWPSVCLSRSLSLGGPGRLDMQLVKQLGTFMHKHQMTMLSEALAWSDDDTPLFTCLPIPATQDALQWTADRITQVQDALGLPVGIRNVSHHAVPPMSAMNEAKFIHELVKKTGCNVHLDITALAENSHRFGFDALAFLKALPMKRVNYVRLGGADSASADAPLNPVAWRLLPAVLSHVHPAVPVCVDDLAQLKRWSDGAMKTPTKALVC